MDMAHDRKHRFRGCLFGLAVGDAVGTTLEFNPPGSFQSITGMAGGGSFRLQPGERTDTSMALCLATSLVEKNGFDPKDQMDRYCQWWKTGYLSSNGRCFDIGNTVATDLGRYEKTGDPIAGSTEPHTAGNGSLMRLAPVPLFFAGNPQKAIEMAGESSRTTHARLRASMLVATTYGGLIVGAVTAQTNKNLCPIIIAQSKATGRRILSFRTV
jgi:ADP-ribosylglycohydrolase